MARIDGMSSAGDATKTASHERRLDVDAQQSEVRPPQVLLQGDTFTRPRWEDPDREAPPLTRYKTFHSDLLGVDVSYLIYLPLGRKAACDGLVSLLPRAPQLRRRYCQMGKQKFPCPHGEGRQGALAQNKNDH